ncbi:MAG: ESPR domain-containing protein, partial [Burkholderiales bacterium]|nr:ESPR domain-containing protein [Burkholderiales bacterium]
MNHIYRTVINRALNLVQVASELAKNVRGGAGCSSSSQSSEVDSSFSGGKAPSSLLAVLIAAMFGATFAFSGGALAQTITDDAAHNTERYSILGSNGRITASKTLYHYAGALPSGKYENTIYRYNQPSNFQLFYGANNLTFTITGLNAATNPTNTVNEYGNTYGQTKIQLIRLVNVQGNSPNGNEIGSAFQTQNVNCGDTCLNGGRSGTLLLKDAYAPTLDGAAFYYVNTALNNDNTLFYLDFSGDNHRLGSNNNGYGTLGTLKVENVVGRNGAAFYLENNSAREYATNQHTYVLFGSNTGKNVTKFTVKDVISEGDIGGAVYFYRSFNHKDYNLSANLDLGTNNYFVNNKATAANGTSAIFMGNSNTASGQKAYATLSIYGNTYFKDNDGAHTIWFEAPDGAGSTINLDSTQGDIVFEDTRGDIYVDKGLVTVNVGKAAGVSANNTNNIFLDDSFNSATGTIAAFIKNSGNILQMTGDNLVSLKDSASAFNVAVGEFRLATKNGNRATLNLGGAGGQFIME